MKKNKAFTLIELLAVIIILAVIALIATPVVLNVIENSKKQANKDSVYGLLDSAKLYYMDALMDSTKLENINGTTNLIDKISLGGERPDNGIIYVNNLGETALAVVYGNICYSKNFLDKDITESENIENCIFEYTDEILNGADPELAEGMIPVIISSDGSLTKADTRAEWYNYQEKEWANVVLVSETSREDYIEATAGTSINTSDVLAYYVWVPRYKYQIFTNKEDIVTTTDYDLNIAKLINVEFESANTKKSTGTTKNEWITHPAFTFGNQELNGIWVGKFETTGTVEQPTILPNVTSLRSQNIATQFQTALKFANNTLNSDGSITHTKNTTYGINDIDSHLMKNSEWGAVAYLATSIYGQGLNEVRINNSGKYITGCAATTAATNLITGEYAAQTDGSEGTYYIKTGCENAYNTSIGVLASTTGNITGIYDMSGGAWEFVMGVMEDSKGSGIPASGRNATYNSGFTGNLTCPTCDSLDGSINFVTGTTLPNSKYYDLYDYGTNISDYTRGHLGDATYELESFSTRISTGNNTSYKLSNWNSDSSYFLFNGQTWFMRGGYFSSGAISGVFASHVWYSGAANGSVSFRSVLAK